jgi:hypothetical protein
MAARMKAETVSLARHTCIAVHCHRGSGGVLSPKFPWPVHCHRSSGALSPKFQCTVTEVPVHCHRSSSALSPRFHHSALSLTLPPTFQQGDSRMRAAVARPCRTAVPRRDDCSARTGAGHPRPVRPSVADRAGGPSVERHRRAGCRSATPDPAVTDPSWYRPPRVRTCARRQPSAAARMPRSRARNIAAPLPRRTTNARRCIAPAVTASESPRQRLTA